MTAGDALLHRALGAIDLLAFSGSCLAEDRQQDDPPVPRDVVGHTLPLPAHVEAQLAQLAAELPGVGLVQVDTLVLQEIDVEGRRPEGTRAEGPVSGGAAGLDRGRRVP